MDTQELETDVELQTPFQHLTSKAEALMEMSRVVERIDACAGQMEKDRVYYKDLTQWTEYKYGPITELDSGSSALPRQDGRKAFNPEKNLKISAIRCFSWAKQQGKTADAARDRAIQKTEEKARTNYSMATLPASVIEYIEFLYQNFAQIGKKYIPIGN